MDLWHRFTKWLDYYRYTALGVIITITYIFWAIGCQIKTPGITNAKPVTTTEFNAQVIEQEKLLGQEAADYEAKGKILQAKYDALDAQIKAAQEDVQRQLQMRQTIMNYAGGIATTLVSGGTIDIPSAISSGLALGFGLWGVASIKELRRKDALLKSPTA